MKRLNKFLSSLILYYRARPIAYPREEHLKCATLGQAPAQFETTC